MDPSEVVAAVVRFLVVTEVMADLPMREEAAEVGVLPLMMMETLEPVVMEQPD
jgi:hypothetical protein